MAQHQYDVWQFGYYAGLNFTSGVATAASAPFYTDEGSTMWCNPKTGALQFSTDGRVVYRANGTVMTNGVGLRGGPSSSSSALIVPFPSNNLDTVKQFYVFCIGDQSWIDETADDSTLTSNIVDFSVDSMGEVTQVNNIINVGLAEKLVATQHCDGMSYWVVVHARSEPVFYAYKVGTKGIEAPIVSRVGKQLVPRAANVRGGPYGQGLMAFSASGKKLAMAVPFSYSVETFDFDTYTGVVSNGVVLDSISRTYGVCFAPNDEFLYTVEWVPGNETGPPVRQFDLSSPSKPIIVGRLRDDDLDFHLGGIQLGPDGRIWLAESNGLACIDQPNVAGNGCQLTNSLVSFSPPARIVVGLPNLITSFFDDGQRKACGPPIAAVAADSMICEHSCMQPMDVSRNVPTSWNWHFEGGTPLDYIGPLPPSICYDTAGTYRIVLVASNEFGSDTVEQRVRVVAPPLLSAGADVVLCDSAAGHLHATGAIRYEWEYQQGIGNTQSADPIVRVFKHTAFVVRGWNAEGCSTTDTVMVYSYPQGKAAVELQILPVHGMVGGFGNVNVIRDSSMGFAPPTLQVHVPMRALMDVVVTKGQELSRVRMSANETVITASAVETMSDTILQLQGKLLLFEGSETITASAISIDSCDRFNVMPALVTADVCGERLRLIRVQGAAMFIDRYSDLTHSVSVGGESGTTATYYIYDVTGRQVHHGEITLAENGQEIPIPHFVHGCCIVQVRTMQLTLSKLIVVD